MSQIFNYLGLDKDKNKTLYINNLKSVENIFREKYIKRLETFNKTSLDNNPEPFRFLLEENCSILILILPKEFDGSTAAEVFILSTPGKRQEIVKFLNHEDLIDLDAYGHHIMFFYKKMLPTLGFDESQIIINLSQSYSDYERKVDYSFIYEGFNLDTYSTYTDIAGRVIRIVTEEIKNFKTINETKLSYFAKDAYKFPFSLLDLRPLINLVSNDDFTYQLDQAMAAYHQNLFLPSAATLGVVLETLCLEILELHGIKVKSGDTQLGKLIERLASERIITRRDNSRLDVAYKVRNIASHSNPGAALREDCHLMLNVINTIAHEYIIKK